MRARASLTQALFAECDILMKVDQGISDGKLNHLRLTGRL
jgi:hypothetical protein